MYYNKCPILWLWIHPSLCFKIDVLQGSRILDASHFESEYILGRKLAFYCKAQGIPRPQITWLKDGIELYAHPFFHVIKILKFLGFIYEFYK